MHNIERIIIYLIVSMLAVLAQAEGKTGYDLCVEVSNGTSSSYWCSGHQTHALNFGSEGQSKGNGNSSKYIKIQGFDDIGLKEVSYTKKGRLKEENRLSIRSVVNSVLISEVVENKSERYKVSITESMPSLLANQESIMYRGEGIYKWNSYTNNKDEIMTNFHAKRFSESSAFFGKYLNAFVRAEVTPTRIEEFMGENYTTQFRITSESDVYSKMRFKSAGEFIDEDYLGTFKIYKNVTMNHNFYLPEDEDSQDGLGCCLPGYGGLEYSLQAAELCLCRSALADANQRMNELGNRA